MKVAQELRAHGRVIRGRLGVHIQEVTPDLARSFGLKSAAGALVLAVERASPADKAGLLAGDIILRVDAAAVETSSDLPQIIAATAPGTTVKLEVWRHGARKQLAATVAEFAPEPRAAATPEARPAPRLGVQLSELTAAQRSALGIAGGLLVRAVADPALRAGVEPGDIILALNDRRVDRIADLNKLLAAVPPRGTVALLVQRAGGLVYLAVRLD
jgi:serine protease Do